MSILLNDLIKAIPSDQIIEIQGDTDALITAPIVEASLDVQKGSLFLARIGLSSDGHQYIMDAIQRGAVTIIGETPQSNLPVPYIQIKDSQQALGYLASAYFNNPSRQLTIIGITGTDGKTTTSHILYEILKVATNNQTGFISTIAADFGGRSENTGLHVTTPGAPQIQAYLAEMVELGLTHCVLEMTSHGLAQGRINGVEIDGAIITNVTHEHLDYHGSWLNYRNAKASMFEMLKSPYKHKTSPTISVINADDESADYFAAIPSDRVFTYGLYQDADFKAEQIQYHSDGTYITLQDQHLHSRLIGEFNVYNILAAITMARALAIDWDIIHQALEQINGVSGRMESIDEGQNFTLIVDFAHTPNALKRALEAGRMILGPKNRLISVFGSAGLRDVQKRRMMAEVSARFADFTILTAEDPRTESLDAILEMMAQGCIAQGLSEGKDFIRVKDRGLAIYEACQLAQPGDLIMVCGKGHEQSMCFGTVEYPWDDREAARQALRNQPLSTLPTANN